MPGLRLVDQGVVYRNPRPHVRSSHAYFPSLCVLDATERLCTVVLGEAFESVDLHAYTVRSADGGASWVLEGELVPRPPGSLVSDACRITAVDTQTVLALVMRYDRTAHPDEGLTSHQTMGFVPTQMQLLRSADRGRTWGTPRQLVPPVAGPCFELCSPVVPLRDGRWLLPTSTWRGWDGECPGGMRMVALVSADHGATWHASVDVMADPRQHVIYWESKIVELPDGTLVATAWAYDQQAAADLPNQYTVSMDGGRSWTTPASTGLHGQTLTPLVLPDGRILCVYRRLDVAGLWAAIATVADGRWVNGPQIPLWGHQGAGLTAHSANMAANFNVLRFGAPCLALEPAGTVMGAFWCYEDCVSNVRWFRVAMGEGA